MTAAWRPVWLLIGLVLAAVLSASWLWAPTRALWDGVDAVAFHLVHGSVVEGGPAWRWIWAAANTRLFDLFATLAFIGLFAVHVLGGGWAALPQRLAQGAFIAGYTTLVLFVSSKLLLDFERLSPSLVLEPVFRLSTVIDAVKVKDVSGNSFPGDHGTATMLFAGFIASFAGRRLGLAAAALAVLVMLPRLVGGAHWLTDLAVGSASVAAVALAVALATPLAQLCVRAMAWPAQAVLRAAWRMRLLPAGAAVLSPGAGGSET